MNMHGIIEPHFAGETRPVSRVKSVILWLRQRYMFALIVVLPTLLTASYLYLIASDEYISEAHFLVRSVDATPSMPSGGGGIGTVLSLATGVSGAQSEAMSIADYLTSHDAVSALRSHDDLVGRYRRPGADLFSRLSKADPTPEQLLKYYRRMVDVEFATETGITTLSVKSFTPKDSYDLVSRLLQLGEARVNELNRRSYADAIAMSQKQLTGVENQLAAVSNRMTHFRQSRSDIDPQKTGEAQLALVKTLGERLASTRAQLNSMGGLISQNSPQYRALQSQVAALQGQVAAESSRLTGSDTAIAADIGGYEDLKLQQQFLSKRYESAAASLESARQQAIKQQLYVVRVVEPNMPVKSLYPERGRILLTVMVALLLVYSIGWLIAAGVKEHAA